MNIKSYTSISDAITDYAGNDTYIVSKSYVGGGDINQAYSCKLSISDTLFLKVNFGKDADFFRAEAMGLSAIADTGAIGCPRVIAYGTDHSLGAFLLIEQISPSDRVSDYWSKFAIELSCMHKADTSSFSPNAIYGFIEDNFIGSTRQYNLGRDSWIDFFREMRLVPQIELAKGFFSTSEKKNLDRLLSRLDDLLIEPDRPSLIHGDLWGGNFITGSDGRAWLIDPAVYVGCAEADIAMTSLFGGFSEEFYETYKDVGLLNDGYLDRVDIYNLYHLLNHLNLFGSSYKSSVMAIVRRYL